MADTPESSLEYGPNVWLIQEMYRQYQEDPSSVGERWQDFFEDYEPSTVAVRKNGDSQDDGEQKIEQREEIQLPEGAEQLKGPGERVVENMEQSLAVPTATSARTLPVKLLEENRRLINTYLADMVAGKVSFTHIISWAILKAIAKIPAMKCYYKQIEGKKYKITPPHINFGVAVDIEKSDGTRGLMVPNIKKADTMDFREFFTEYNEIIRKVRTKKIQPDDFAGTTVTLTNPGTIGTNYSVPRLMDGQAAIFGTGAISYPAEWESADPTVLARLGVSKVITVTSTYDHRVIQGAESGMFLSAMYEFLMGNDDFYDEIYESLGVPFRPILLDRDTNTEYDDRNPDAAIQKQSRVLQMLNLYRVRGHLQANTNPLVRRPSAYDELDPKEFGLTIWDYDREFITLGMAGKERATLREIMNVVRDTYCRTIGYEYMHIQDRDQKRWFRSQAEGKPRNTWLTLDEKRRILAMLTEAEAFEKFLHTKYLGHKRFSLEGAETLIPVMDLLLQDAGNTPTTDVVIGMAHRGRLNMLANILGKSYQKIFKEFSGDVDPDTMQGSGDVKYHLGASGVFTTKTGKEMKIFLASNPSHLEAVDPVVEGMARALQDMKLDAQHRMVLPVLIHGDAAFAGQGVVSETLNLSKVPGYRTGGTVHIIVNNLIGFTTSPEEARSSVYATDVAKAVQAPIFHVNGDDPEAAARVIRLALAFRQEFQKDVVVDIMCYRKHGHNETDDPSYTQPKMYSHIKEKRSIRKLYTELLVNRGDITLDEAEQSMEQFHKRLEEAFEATKDQGKSKPNKDNVIFEVPAEDVGEIVETGVSHESLELIAASFNRFPNGFTVHPKLEKLFKERSKVIEKGEVDWPVAELLAFGTILLDGKVVRLAGQDSKRGTFSQRHSVAIDYKTEEAYYPLANLSADQGKFRIFDSTLSEFAALGFEYGYSVMFKSALVMWEAQFGDFVNGAQVIIDQFIAAAEDKWNQQSRLTLLLPHGFEGQGPEHSSARLERFLILCAENNMRVTYPTSAAQYFHLLRRQATLDDRKPLIVLTPKSLLRAKEVRSPIEALEEGSFQFTLDDPNPPKQPTRILLCTGKIGYDLLKHRDENEIDDTAIVRIEQLYPFPFNDIEKIFRKYDQVRDVRWVQEEPRNMGAWNFVYGKLRDRLDHPYTLHFVGRLVSGSPATGSSEVHAIEQEYLIQQAFGDIEDLD